MLILASGERPTATFTRAAQATLSQPCLIGPLRPSISDEVGFSLGLFCRAYPPQPATAHETAPSSHDRSFICSGGASDFDRTHQHGAAAIKAPIGAITKTNRTTHGRLNRTSFLLQTTFSFMFPASADAGTSFCLLACLLASLPSTTTRFLYLKQALLIKS
jgi:hypothetical protein